MAILDALVVLGVFGAFGFLIMSRLSKRKPEFMKRVREWMPKSFVNKPPEVPTSESKEQIYPEKRSMM